MISESKLTIGIPTYNRPQSLRIILDCFLRQTFKEFNIIVSDNSSTTPETRLILEEYAKNDSRITFVTQKENIGPARNFEYLLQHCNTEYFMWHSDDDEMSSEFYLEELIKVINDETDFVFPNIYKYTTNSKNERVYLNKGVNLNLGVDTFENHFELVKKSYFGYQLVSGIYRTEILKANTTMWFKSQGYINSPDEGQILQFLLSRYNWKFVPNVAHVKNMSDSYDFRNNLISALLPTVWHFFGVFGQIAMSKYTNWQKIKFGIVYFARCVYIWLTIGYYDIKKKLGFIKS